MEDLNVTSEIKTNATLSKVAQFFNISVSKVTNQSEETKIRLFDLYEVYKKQEQEQLVAYKYVAIILASLIIVSNLIVVISSGLILRKGQQPKNTYLLLGNVSLADTIIGISIIIGMLVDTSNMSSLMCIFQIGLIVCPVIVSIFSVGLIAIDRYIYILHGLYYQRWFSTTRIRIAIMFTWVIGIFVACLPAMGWTGNTFRNYRCWYITVFPPALLIVMSMIVLSVIIFVCILYFLILRSAVRTVNKIREMRVNTKVSYINEAFENHIESSTAEIEVRIDDMIEMKNNYNNEDQIEKNNRTKNKLTQIASCVVDLKVVDQNPSKFKAIKTVLLVTACFLGTWGPYYIAIIMYVNCDIENHGYDCIPLEILTLGPLYLLGISNSLLDPMIYAWRHSGFKRTVLRIYWKFLWKFKT